MKERKDPAMTFSQCQDARFSVRRYSDKKVDSELLQSVLEAGRKAPTACNNQPQYIYALQSEEALEKIKKAANIHDGPCVLLICADRTKAWVRPYDGMNAAVIDATIVTDQMMMAATELGLSTLWICHFQPDLVRESFSLPPQLVPVNLLVLGYAADGVTADPDRFTKMRKPLCETCCIL